MPRIRWSLLIRALAVLHTACGPIRATTGVVDARAAIRAAEEVNADSVALYEMTLAREYLGKAREEMGYNDYYVAEQLCIKAVEHAVAAREKAVGVDTLIEDDGSEGGPVLEEPDLDVLPDIGELAPDRRAGDEEEGDDLLQPEGSDPWGSNTQPVEGAPTTPPPAAAPPAADPQPILPEGVPWGTEPTTTPTPTPPPPVPPATGTAPPAEAPPAQEVPAEAEEEEEEEGDLLLPDWLDEEDP